MNNNMTKDEFVNSYLDNELTDIERLDFESKLPHDPELSEEYNFQKELIDGINNVRRLELKSRLSNILISTPLYQTIGFKAIAIASVSVGIGFGAYYLFDVDNEPELATIDLKRNQITLSEEKTTPEIPKAILPVIDEDESDKKKTKKTVSKVEVKSEPLAKNTESKIEPKIIQPNVIQPEVVESFDDEHFETKDANGENQINNLDKIKENVESTVEVATVKDKRNKFHYKFFENKLFLLGNFNDMPYEILELNLSEGKSFFLYYNDNFYRLNSEQEKAAPLMRIENDSLVNELKIIRLNQNN
jgi:hypothetical protein